MPPLSQRGTKASRRKSRVSAKQKAPEKAKQEDAHVPKNPKGSSKSKKPSVTGCLEKAPVTDTHITGLQDEIDDVPLEEWVEKCKAGQQATKNDKDAEIDEVASDALVEQFMANDPESCE